MNQPIDLSLTLLQGDRSLQPRTTGESQHHIRQLIESDPERWPPLLVRPSNTGDGTYIVIDGWHRAHTARRKGLKSLTCIVLPATAGYAEAFLANRDHGLPLTTEDRKHYARWLHEQFPDWSLRRLGQDAGLNHETVRKALQGPVSTNRQPDRPKPTPAERLVDLVYLKGGMTHTDIQRAIELYKEEDWSDVATEVVRSGTAMVKGGDVYL